jgi:hypothetical protein
MSCTWITQNLNTNCTHTVLLRYVLRFHLFGFLGELIWRETRSKMRQRTKPQSQCETRWISDVTFRWEHHVNEHWIRWMVFWPNVLHTFILLEMLSKEHWNNYCILLYFDCMFFVSKLSLVIFMYGIID